MAEQQQQQQKKNNRKPNSKENRRVLFFVVVAAKKKNVSLSFGRRASRWGDYFERKKNRTEIDVPVSLSSSSFSFLAIFRKRNFPKSTPLSGAGEPSRYRPNRTPMASRAVLLFLLSLSLFEL